MKIKLFSGKYPETLENNVNDFIKSADIDVVDIKFSSSDQFTDIMVIYKEKTENT